MWPETVRLERFRRAETGDSGASDAVPAKPGQGVPGQTEGAVDGYE